MAQGSNASERFFSRGPGTPREEAALRVERIRKLSILF